MTNHKIYQCFIAAFALVCHLPSSAAESGQRLGADWEYHQGSLGSTWEIWRGEAASDNVTWTPVTLPHCFNARDAVDPEVRYYQGPGWYRTRIKVENPFPNGRTLLHFDGAGQSSQVFIGNGKVGEHLGGYDEWTVDITGAIAKLDPKDIPLAVRCDNSRDAESIPSDLSDFNRYGGLYRHVTLHCVPAVSLERVHITPNLTSAGIASVKVRSRLLNPGALRDELELDVEISDPAGKVIHQTSKKMMIHIYGHTWPIRWGKPAKFTLAEVGRNNDTVTIEARVFDKHGAPCLDAANLVKFGLTGDGKLIDNLGTASGSRIVQLANGRARISLEITGSTVVASISSDGIETGFTTVKAFDVAAIDRARILKAAEAALVRPPISITRHSAKLSEGGPNDFYSNGDYWWPDPNKPDGLPYLQRDGQTNPENFNQHRMAIRDLRDAVAALAAAYKITRDDRHVEKATELLRVFFLDPATRMNPHLNYAQAIPGRTPGRGIGIIDTLHLIEIPVAIAAMSESPAFPPEVAAGLKDWFAAYLDWMITSKNGKEEAVAKNNHAVAFWLQVAVFARFTANSKHLAECRRQFTEVFLPEQMAADGSFPAELARTKPYAYSIFQLDNMVTLCQVLTTPADDLRAFELPDGRGIRKAVAFLYPFLADKSKWPRKPDVQAWEGWPARQPSLVFSGFAYGETSYLDLWRKLPPDPTDPEVRRNIAITQPVLWLK